MFYKKRNLVRHMKHVALSSKTLKSHFRQKWKDVVVVFGAITVSWRSFKKQSRLIFCFDLHNIDCY